MANAEVPAELADEIEVVLRQAKTTKWNTVRHMPRIEVYRVMVECGLVDSEPNKIPQVTEAGWQWLAGRGIEFPVNGAPMITVYLRYDYAGTNLKLIEMVTPQDSEWRSWMEPGAVKLHREIYLDLKAAAARIVEMEQRTLRFLDLSQQHRPELAT